MDPIVIVSAARTPLGAFNGKFKSTSTVELGATVIKKVVEDFSAKVDSVYMGCVLAGQQVKIDELNKNIVACKKEIQEQELETENLTNTISSMSEDAYIEEVARERLGLVMPTEIIFMDASI